MLGYRVLSTLKRFLGHVDIVDCGKEREFGFKKKIPSSSVEIKNIFCILIFISSTN